MTFRIEHDEIETLLREVETGTGLGREAVLLGLLRKERERLAELERREHDAAEAIESGRLRHEGWMAKPLIDPRSLDEILAYDENGLPV